jgi:putative membrane protein
VNKLIKILTAVLVVMFPVGLFLMLSGDTWKQYLWTTNIFLALQAIVTFIYLMGAAKKKSAGIIAFAILILAFVIELVGVKTGLPFGSYSYTKTLEPALFGVPLAITLSWFTIAVNAYLVTRFFLSGSKKIFILVVSAVIILAIDFLLEPFASSINGYWVWGTGKIPVQNYISWFVTGFIFAYLLDRFILWNRNIFLNLNFIAIPAVILLINVLQFAAVNIYFGYIIITLIGLAMLAASILFGFKIRTDES